MLLVESQIVVVASPTACRPALVVHAELPGRPDHLFGKAS
jgi:hypothetical protein